MPEPVRQYTKDAVSVSVYRDRAAMGSAAANAVAARVRLLLAEQASVRMIFAAAPSQDEMLDALAVAEGIDWRRVTALHMDEYYSLPSGARELFQTYLRDHIMDRVRPGRVEFIGIGIDPAAEAERYAGLIRESPIDVVCLGIGENGHIAFNDPPVADFEDLRLVKIVELDRACREQQVHDGAFPSVDAVPTHAMTLTIPALMSGRHLFCTVPGSAKRRAVERALTGPISTSCPASVLRRHPDCKLFLDLDSAGSVALS